MHAAPTVHWPVQRLRPVAGALALLWCIGLLTHLCWWLLSPVAASAHFGALLVLCISGGLAGRFWIRSPVGQLQSTDQDWLWTPERALPVRGELEVCIDLQRIVLLRFMHGRGRVAWLWATSLEDAGAWRAFRRALFAPRGSGRRGLSEHSRDSHVNAAP